MSEVVSPAPQTAAPERDMATAPIALSIIIPTFNESKNVEELFRRLDKVLAGVSWEAVLVDDDSPDGTSDLTRAIARKDRRVRVLQRIGRKGLSTAVVEGMLASAGPVMAVMDGDLQHDENILPQMLREIEAGADVAIGTRYAEGGSVGTWAEDRQKASTFATKLAKFVIKADVSDPMSGFFMIRREAAAPALRRVSGVGFKILLDILASSPTPLAIKEVPFTFRERFDGESKFDIMVMWEFAMMLVDKKIGHIIPIQFIMFSAVGGSGLVVHLACLGLLNQAAGVGFAVSQTIATIVAMTSNFILNNILTYRHQRKTGWSFLWGLLSFYAVCSLGAVANVGIANAIHNADQGWVLSGVAGALVGSVWNFAASRVFTWRN